MYIRNASVTFTGGSATSSNTVPITINSVSYESFVTGKLTKDITATWTSNNCATKLLTGNSCIP